MMVCRIQVERRDGEQPTGVARVRSIYLIMEYISIGTAHVAYALCRLGSLAGTGARKRVENRRGFRYLPGSPFRS